MANPIEQLSRVRFDELALFVEVASAGSLSAAAKRLSLPKSTVGRALTRMERDLGVTLVRRSARGPALTEVGRMLASSAAPHVAALRDLTAAVGRSASEVFGALRITAPADIGTLVIAPLLAVFAARYPRVRVEVDLSLNVSNLTQEGFDLAIRVAQGRRLAASELLAKPLARLDLGFYAGPSYLAQREAPKRVDELSQHELVLFDGRNGKSVLNVESARGTTQLTIRGRMSANDFFFVREALCGGAGIGPLPWFVARSEVAAGRLVRVLPDCKLGGVTAYLVHPRLATPSPKLDAFRAFLLEHGPALLLHP